ncbi:hypothetical protein CHS0354_034049 [Potamilus streckersoni]|uniref:Uncharacterized protein n=1 Tax=Potamilus streckersoni TaxID=2493646 RepID=A0AAE0SHU1_9BIVA|nr:hypothetical protein CHS0354_034049 [Potamilus streckersoni]
MASAGGKPEEWKLDHIGTLELEHTQPDPKYIGFVVLSADVLMVVDGGKCTVRLYSQHDGRLLAKSDTLQSGPSDVCLMNRRDTQVAVTGFGYIEVLSVNFTSPSPSIRTVRTLDLAKDFDCCYGVRALKSGKKLAVSGRKKDKTGKCWLCWSLVTHEEEHDNTVRNICEYGGYTFSYLDISSDDSTVYISCFAGDYSNNHGVYAFDIMDGTRKFMYRHSDLTSPTGISVDRMGYIYVCNWTNPGNIHQLTEKGKLMSIHREGVPPMPKAMFWDDQQEHLNVTRMFSREVWKLHPVRTGHQVLPPEILNKDESFQKLYIEALANGKEKAYNIRVMIVGNQGVGKTSLVQRLLGEQVKEGQSESTEGIEVHTRCCQIDHATGEWKRQHKTDELHLIDQRIASLVQKYTKIKEDSEANDAENGISSTRLQKSDLRRDETVPSILDGRSDNVHNEMELKQISKEAGHIEASEAVMQISNEEGHLEASEAVDTMGKTKQTGNGSKGADKMHPEELKNIVDRAQNISVPRSMSSDVTLLDFAGQSLFYTTHQVFMSWRTLYLLVIDMSLPLTATVEEGNYRIDLSGRKASNIQEYVTYWLNSVHSHALISEDYRMRRDEKTTGGDQHSESVEATRKHPFVILVGTHSDKIPKELLDQRKESYFNEIRIVLKNSPLMLYLSDEDFAISNLGSDPNINTLKSKIYDVARKQVYWGEEIPARWILLKRALIELKNRGIQVMAYEDVKSLNEKLQVNIKLPEEFDLFLSFEHDSGNIIFFNTERLRKNVVLDPEWLINGVRTWITSDRGIRRHPELTDQWFAFKHTGRLTLTLLEKLWSAHSEIHRYKQHLLDVMEELSIIAKPLQMEGEDYYWVPCMVSTSAPENVTKLQQNKDTTRTSTLCFRSKNNFIHVGVFHRLLATCLSKWAPAKEGNTYLVFRGLCVFKIDEQHQLFISLNDFVIHATVIRFTRRGRIPELSRCMAIRDELYTALSEISDCLCPGSELEICIKCKESSPLTNEGLHSVSTLRLNDELGCSTHTDAHCVESMDLLRFWEEDTTQMPANVLPQHLTLPSERFTRICSLVLDVGSKVLRELLTCCTTPANCKLDQYMRASRAQILQLQRKRVLTQVQVDIIFPPGGQTDINEYDISLASALLNNIYTFGQQEKQLIIDLRTQRNELAHTRSTKMSEKDFQIKWKKVETILKDLCRLCNDPKVDSKVQKEILDIQKSGSCAIISKLTKVREELKKISQLLEEI